ncbi:winged helix-turn-helix domain-containing protein [Entomohabitans teleogrylli]|uniref:winged helix-turn-helix domain-containing protein n=1 Tax=Entomohabitans teleogrylli TaxID=1384589 RepID=UPI00073D1CAE|nr:helix-turn-helix domain-containing protein [Entomohabitans teleogrylli]
MNFLIDDKVIYESLNGTLRAVNEGQADAVTLTTIANKILFHLINHHGELVSRNTLFDEIWEKEGVASSSNTLNQYISLLRKAFARYFGDTEVIITVPRAGYTFSKEIKVTTWAKKVKVKNRHIPVIASLVAVAIAVSGLFYYFNLPVHIAPRKIGELQGCPVYNLSGVRGEIADVSEFAVAQEIMTATNSVCAKNTSFYIYVEETLHLYKPARVLFSRCVEWADSRNTCQNVYYYKWSR